MTIGVWVFLDAPVGFTGEEEPVQRACAPARALLVDVLSLKHRFLSHIAWLLDHSGVGLKVWPVVPRVAATDCGISNLASEHVANKSARGDSVVAEDQARGSTRLGLREVMHPSVQTNSRDTTLRRLHASADGSSDGPGESRAKHPVAHESILVLALNAALVLPWDAFWVGRVLAEAVSEPRVTLEVFLEEVHVLTFHLLGRNGRLPHLENLIGLFCQLVNLLTVLIIEGRLAEDLVVASVKLARHFSLRLVFCIILIIIIN